MSATVVQPVVSPRVLVIGDVMIDRYLWGTCDRVSPEAPVQVVSVQRETHSLGGAGNVLANLLALGAQTRLVAMVGGDVDQTPMRSLLRESGASDGGLVVDPTRPTTVKTRVVAVPQQIVRYDREVAQAASPEVEALLLARVSRELESGCDVLILSDYGKGVLTPALCKEVIAQARVKGVPVLVDPKGTDYSKYAGATLLTPNRREAGLATGTSLSSAQAISEAGRALLARHALDACLITLSEHGMALFVDGVEHRIPTAAREVFDVTGAGDTVIAAVAFGVASKMSLLEACQLANRAAGIVVGKVGAATVTLDEIRRADEPSSASIDSKLLDRAALKTKLAALRDSGRRVVFTNGCFDLVHAGHVRYLAAAKQLGDVLVVAVNSDDSVSRLKGPSRPVVGAQDRIVVLAALASTDFVTIFDEDTPGELIDALQPDVLVKGGDYVVDDIVGADSVRRRGGQVHVLPFLEGRSTSATISRVKGTT